MLAGVLQHFGFDDLDLDSPRVLEPLAQRFRDRQRVGERAAERLRSLLQLGIMVALRLDIVADPRFRRDQRARVGSPLLAVRPAPNLAHRGVEPGNAFGDRGRIVRKLDQLVPADPEVGEHRVGEDLAELGCPSGLGAFRGERLHVDIEYLGKPQQDAGRDRPLVAFEMVQVRSGNAELVGHLALVEPAIAAQSLEPCTEEELALKHLL